LKNLDCNLYDVGCGDGEFLGACQKRGIRIGGCEPQARGRDQAEKNLNCRIDENLFASTEDQLFDAVTVWHVIEHVDNPGKMIRDIWNNLKPGGLLAVSTVNIDSWQARIFGTNWLHLDPPRHLWIGSRKAVEQLLVKNGFVIEKKRSNFLEFGPIGFVDSVINSIDSKRDRLLKCLKTGFYGSAGKVTWITAAFLTPFGIIFSAIETLFGKSATFEIYARKSVIIDSE
jgi:SAM-dependent methyltransferase